MIDLFPTPTTDAEYIHEVERSLAFRRKSRPIIIGFNAVFLVLSVYYLHKLSGIIRDLNGDDPESTMMLGFATGALLGFAFVHLFYKALQHLIHALRMDRTAQLLVRYARTQDAMRSGLANGKIAA